MKVEDILNSETLIEVGRKAVEDMLVDFRDSRIFIMRNNGFVIKERDGTSSSCIRLSVQDGLTVALRAILAHWAEKNKPVDRDDGRVYENL